MTTAASVETILTDEHEVILTLDPEHLADAIVQALAGLAARGKLALVRQLATDSPVRAQALRDVVRALDRAGATQVTLTADEAKALADDLDAAAYVREPCARSGCDWLADETGLCTQHQETDRSCAS